MVSREFNKFMEVQEALRAYYGANPGKEAPRWLIEQLEQAHHAYEQARGSFIAALDCEQRGRQACLDDESSGGE